MREGPEESLGEEPDSPLRSSADASLAGDPVGVDSLAGSAVVPFKRCGDIEWTAGELTLDTRELSAGAWGGNDGTVFCLPESGGFVDRAGFVAGLMVREETWVAGRFESALDRVNEVELDFSSRRRPMMCLRGGVEGT